MSNLVLSGGSVEDNVVCKASEVNHLRRLLGWLRCELGQTPEEFMETMKKIAPAITEPISEDSKQRLIETYDKAMNVPLYVRQAVNMLTKLINEHDKACDTVDAEVIRNRLDSRPLPLSDPTSTPLP